MLGTRSGVPRICSRGLAKLQGEPLVLERPEENAGGGHLSLDDALPQARQRTQGGRGQGYREETHHLRHLGTSGRRMEAT